MKLLHSLGTVWIPFSTCSHRRKTSQNTWYYLLGIVQFKGVWQYLSITSLLSLYRLQHQNDSQSEYLFCLIPAQSQTKIFIFIWFLQGIPNPDYTYHLEAEGSSEVSKGVALATIPCLSYLIHLSQGSAFSSVSWMGEESTTTQEEGSHRE